MQLFFRLECHLSLVVLHLPVFVVASDLLVGTNYLGHVCLEIACVGLESLKLFAELLDAILAVVDGGL